MIKGVALIVFQIFMIVGNILGQGVNNIWLLGYGNGTRMKINFDSLPPIPNLVSRKMNFMETEANISNKSGNLLFYTNGIFIADASNDTMQNGDGLSTGSFGNQFVNFGLPVPQAALILQNPGDTNIYYLFYTTFTLNISGYWQPQALYNCIIDMTLNGGLGGVVQKHLPLIQDTLIASELTACKHANGRDWWIITHRYNSDLYYKFLLTPSGILGPYTQNIGSFMYVRGPSQSCFSPDGKRFACYHPLEDLDIMSFDRCSGDFSNYIHVPINDSAGAGGVAFSPNSQLLYVSSTNYVYQFNMSASNIVTSQTKVATWDGFYSPGPPFATTFYLSQLAPDGKIYISSNNSVKHIHVINYPDSIGVSCNLIQHSLALPAYNAFTVPNHPNYFLGADSGSVCDTLQLGTNEINNKGNIIFRIYPNPAIDFINLIFTPDEQIKEIEILNVDGEIILKRNIPQWCQINQIDVSNLINGIYLCRFKTLGKTTSYKFIKTSQD